MTTTFRKELDRAGFNWDSDWKIIAKKDIEGNMVGFCWNDEEQEKELITDPAHPVFDVEYYEGYGLPNTPKFVGEDDVAIYFPWQYDGASGFERVLKDILQYMNEDVTEFPYPGG